ncbi:MAG: TAXI family TRAP transporter solute-binding subunit [Cryobacterium sp.]|nr:TAXI family TRAP transporter solute-binding subunit [Cryobacterium sp.]
MAIASIALTACSATNEPIEELDAGTPFTWAYGTGAVGGTSYNIGAAQAEAVRASGSHVTLIAEETAGGPSNVTRLANGELQMAFIQASEVYAGLNGTGNFEATGAVTGLELAWAGTEGGVGIVAPSSTGITSYADLCGRKLGTTSAGAKTNLDALLTSAGVDSDCIDWQIGATYDQMVTAMADGTLDAAGLIGIPVAAGSATLQAAETMEINFVSADPADKEKHDAMFPYWPLSTVPAGSFPGQTNDWLIAGFYQALYTSSAVPEQQVYEAVKALSETSAACTAIQAGCGQFTLERTAEVFLKTGIAIAPPHAGLVRLLEEAGIDYK